MEKFFPFITNTVFRVKCIACVTKSELNFGSDANSVRFPVVAATPTAILLMEPSVYMCFHPLHLFSMSSLNLFWLVRVGVLSSRKSHREKFILVLGSPQVGCLISS